VISLNVNFSCEYEIKACIISLQQRKKPIRKLLELQL
jgi:hypothetical protein